MVILAIVKFTSGSIRWGTPVFTIHPRKSVADGWGRFKYYFELDFTEVDKPGRSAAAMALAAELFKTTGDPEYLEDATRYARMAGTISWMPLDTARHYQYYPFINAGHFVLHGLVNVDLGNELAGFYRAGIESCLEKANRNSYGIGIPFIWRSNNLLTSLITQVILYEKMTKDLSYHKFLV